MGSPLTTWEGATAYFTGAHSSFSIGLFLLLALAATVYTIVDCARHEARAYDKVKNGK